MKEEVKEPEFDLKLLVNTLSIQTNSKDESKANEYIEKRLKELNIPFTIDEANNILVIKGESDLYPCLVSHKDTVHDITSDKKIYQAGDILFAFCEEDAKQIGIGGDDLVGVSMCLNALQDLPNLKVVFFSQEEIGCKGSGRVDMTFFDDCSVVLQADRKGNSGFVTCAAGTDLSSIEFQTEIKDILILHGYSTCKGSVTDVMTLKNRGLSICAANIECGYYEPHTSKEVVSISSAEDCYNMITEILEYCKDKIYTHILEVPKVPERSFEKSNFRGSRYDYGQYDQGELPFDNSSPFKDDYPQPWKDPKREAQVADVLEALDEQESIEEILEEIDISVNDMESTLNDWKQLRQKMVEKLGRI